MLAHLAQLRLLINLDVSAYQATLSTLPPLHASYPLLHLHLQTTVIRIKAASQVIQTPTLSILEAHQLTAPIQEPMEFIFYQVEEMEVPVIKYPPIIPISTASSQLPTSHAPQEHTSLTWPAEAKPTLAFIKQLNWQAKASSMWASLPPIYPTIFPQTPTHIYLSLLSQTAHKVQQSASLPQPSTVTNGSPTSTMSAKLSPSLYRFPWTAPTVLTLLLLKSVLLLQLRSFPAK